jgi:hypothetical protein
MNNLITNYIDAENSYIYDVELTHPDYSPKFCRVFAQTAEDITYRELDSPAYTAELVRGIWNKCNASGFYHEMKVTLTLVLEEKPLVVTFFEGGLYDISELEERARKEAEEEEEE